MKRERSVVLCVFAAAGVCSSVHGQQMKPILDQGRFDEGVEIIHAPVVACFAQGTDPMYVRRVEAMVAAMNAARFGQLDYQLDNRWSGVQGSPRALTWSFVPDGLSISSGVGEPTAPSNLFAQMDSKFASVGGRTTWVAQFTSVFNRWQELSGLSYTRITVGGNDWDDGAVWGAGGLANARGDVRISGKNIDGANGILAYNSYPSNGDMVMDTSESWQSGSPTFRFLRNTISHEHGHGMGLRHVCPIANAKLMEPFLSTVFDGPQQDDIRAAQRHYGDPFETNDTAATAKPIGALAIPGSITFGNIPNPAVGNAALLSIDANGEVDFWSFTVPAACLVSATVTPIGSTYLSGAQTSQCNTGTSINALAMADLSVAVIGSNGTTVLGSSETQPAGSPETVLDVGLPTAGTYYVRVTEANTPTESQLYRLTVTVTGQPICPTIVQNPQPEEVCQGLPVSFTFLASGNPAPTYQWRRNGEPLIGNGANTSTYNLFFALTSNAGTYDCIATNSCGSIASAEVELTVFTEAGFTDDPDSQSVAVGMPVTFSVQVSGDPEPTLSWRKNGVPIPGANQVDYTIVSVTPGDAGFYDCRAESICGEAVSEPALLTVTEPTCYANCDGSTGSPLLTANDFQCFLNKFAAGDSYANCDGSTGAPQLTANDFQCFLNKFAAGCS